MRFSDLEQIMLDRGIDSLADIARALDTTPQAVSNWKSRDQVPYHIVTKIDNKFSDTSVPGASQVSAINADDSFNLSDILLMMAKQLKIILIVPIITVFLTFTYMFSTNVPFYESSAKILLPENKSSAQGFMGLASQFGVDVQQQVVADLSSPSLFPELVKSYTFAERIMDEKFYVEKYEKKLSLLEILSGGPESASMGRDTIIRSAISKFNNIVTFTYAGKFSVLTVRASEPALARDINLKVLDELQELNRFFKSENVTKKIRFIKSRIAAVGKDLEDSENKLKIFREQNRQVSSPALMLEQEHLTRDVDIQKGIYLTLKQQLEMANIEKIQKEDILQILDEPQIPLAGTGNNLKAGIVVSGLIGLGLGLIIAAFRTYINSNDKLERIKFRRIRRFFIQKIQDIFLDKRFSGIITVLLMAGSPFYIGHKSSNPVFFGMYSAKLMFIIIIYFLLIITFFSMFIYSLRSGKK